MQPGAVPFSHFFDRKNLSTQGRKLSKFLLNCFQPFMPLGVSGSGICDIPVLKTILFIQLLNVGDFRSKTRNLFSKNLKVIHTSRITHLHTESVCPSGNNRQQRME